MAGNNEEKPAETEADKEKKKSVSALRSGLEEIIDGTKSAFNLGVAAAIPYGADSFMGGIDASSTAAAFYLGARDKSSRSARLESIIGTAFAGFAKLTLGAINTFGAYTRAALIPPWQAAANAFYLPIDHLVKNKSFSGLGKKFKEKYTDLTKKAILYLSIPTYLTTFLPGPLQIPSIAIQSWIFRKYIAKDKEQKSEPKDKTSYYEAAYNAGTKLVNNTLKGSYEAVYAVGSTLYDKIKNFFKAATAPQTQAPATAPAR